MLPIVPGATPKTESAGKLHEANQNKDNDQLLL
jgi:hypothetical protein